MRAAPRTIVEIGVAEGASAMALREAMFPEGTLYLIDPFHLSRIPALNFLKHAAHRAVRSSGTARIVWVDAFSHDAVLDWKLPIDFLLIDGDHREEAVELTGPSHSGVELHGFLSYLVKVAISGGTYSVFGYKAKQVHDNIHSHDVVCAMEEFAANPRCGEAYNLGGGRENSISLLEAIAKIEEISGKKLNWKYVDENRKGDHICYISDLSKFKSHYPNWKIATGLDEIFHQIIADYTQRLQSAGAR